MFQPLLPLTGLPGWNLLNRTLDTQTRAFNASPQIVRDTDYFEANIGSVTTAEDLVADRRLLSVALSAFGLEEDINNRFLIRKVLEDGTTDPAALANRLADSRYAELSDAFGFGNGLFGPFTGDEGFGERITDLYRIRSFEVAVGEQDESLRLAMNAQREIASLAEEDAGNDTLWFRVLGTPPLRTVFETAFGLPSGFGQLDIERQLEEFKDAAKDNFDIENFTDLTDESKRERLIETYLLRDQIQNLSSGLSAQSIALTLLQS